MTRSLLEKINTLRSARLLVLGDLMLDRYVSGEADRVSPEAPVVVLRATDQEVRPGGAAGVAAFLRGLAADVSLAGVVGADHTAATLHSVCRDESIHTDFVHTDSARPTTLKERFIGKASDRHGHQMLRVDVESSVPISQQIQDELIDSLVARIPDVQCVLIADYAKGVCTPEVLRQVIETAGRHDIPVLVDPGRGVPIDVYRGVTVLKPNRTEAEALTGVSIDSVDDARQAAALLHQQGIARHVIVTLDKDGCVLCDGSGSPQHIPTSQRDVYDITGAGDMFLAMLGLSLANGHALDDSAALANLAAGLEVERVGSVPVTIDELQAVLHRPPQRPVSASAQQPDTLVTLETAAAIAESSRQAGQRVVFTNGCFDLLHYGHVRSLQEAADMGDVLIVAINSDASVRKLKGPERPVISEHERAAMLKALACVDHVLIFGDETPHPLLRAIRPDILVKGGAYPLHEVVGHEVVTAYGGEIATTAHINGISTTAMLNSIRGDLPCT